MQSAAKHLHNTTAHDEQWHHTQQQLLTALVSGSPEHNVGSSNPLAQTAPHFLNTLRPGHPALPMANTGVDTSRPPSLMGRPVQANNHRNQGSAYMPLPHDVTVDFINGAT